MWCVTVLHNGDIAAGCSDHRIYVFTNDIQRSATADRMVSRTKCHFCCCFVCNLIMTSDIFYLNMNPIWTKLMALCCLQALYHAELEEFQKSLIAATNGTSSSGLPEEVGGVKVCDMPIGPEALSVPGKRDGQTKMVKWPKENKITAHSWSEGKKKSTNDPLVI